MEYKRQTRKWLLHIALVFALLLCMTAIAGPKAVTVMFENGEILEVPQGHKVVIVPEDAPTHCKLMCKVKLDPLMPETIDPPQDCDGLAISPSVCDPGEGD